MSEWGIGGTSADWNETAAGGASMDSGWGGGNSAAGTGGDGAWNDGGFDTNMNEHNNDGRNGEGGDRACYNCGEPGHSKVDCPNPRVFSGTCNLCGEEGHMRKECPKYVQECRWCKASDHTSRECANAPPMTCRRCGAEDHIVKDCPQPMICNECKGEGHFSKECPDKICKNCGNKGHGVTACDAERRLIDRSNYPTMSPSDAWNMLSIAIKARDMDDIKEAVEIYAKSMPDATYPQLEEAFRTHNMKLWLIAIEKPAMMMTLTNMDLQGHLDKKYTVSYRFDPNPARPRERDGWPPSPEENLKRLADAGQVVDRLVPKCSNCKELGHISKSCPQEKQEVEQATVGCFNCGGTGHRVRDCPEPRIDKFACKNCGKGGHNAKECPEPRNPATVECNNCNQMGHFSRDCPDRQGDLGGMICHNCGKPGHKSKDCTMCTNCEKDGHTWRDCPQPKDWSKVTCSQCKEKGHTKARCKNAMVVEDNGDFGVSGNGDTADTGGDGGWGPEATEPVPDANGWSTAGADAASGVDAW